MFETIQNNKIQSIKSNHKQRSRECACLLEKYKIMHTFQNKNMCINMHILYKYACTVYVCV